MDLRAIENISASDFLIILLLLSIQFVQLRASSDCTITAFCLHACQSSEESHGVQDNSLTGRDIPKLDSLEKWPWVAEFFSFDGVSRS